MLVRITWIFSLLFLVFSDKLFAEEKSAQDSIAITEDGVGPINASTPFDLKTVQKLMPGLKVKRGTSFTEGEEFPILKVSDLKVVLFTIIPDDNGRKIFSIVTKSNRVKNSFGVKIGDMHVGVFGDKAGDCSPGMEEYAGTVSCLAPRSKHVHYIFVGKWDGSDNEIPPQEVFKSWTVSEIFWKP
jgi:Protein of unknown function (DUF1131)